MTAGPEALFVPEKEERGNVIQMPPILKAEDVYYRYSDMVYRLALARCRSVSDAEDVLQDVFTRYVRSDPSFDSAAHQKAWLIRATINCTNSLLTSAWRRHTTPLDELTAGAEAVGSDDEAVEVYAAVLRLPKNLRTVIHLYYYEGYRVNEIAELTNSNTNTVKSWLRRARERLEKDLKGDLFDV